MVRPDNFCDMRLVDVLAQNPVQAGDSFIRISKSRELVRFLPQIAVHRYEITSDLDLLCSCITRTPIFKSTRDFLCSKALKSVLNVHTLKVPTLTRRCFLRFTILRLAADSEEVMVCRDRYLRLLT